MDDEKVSPDGAWLCEHEPPAPPNRLNEKDAKQTPPHYVICPDCGTHWIVWSWEGRGKFAKPVIIPFIWDGEEESVDA